MSEIPGLCWAIAVRFMVPEISSSVIVGVMSCVGFESVPPIIILNLLRLVHPCLKILRE